MRRWVRWLAAANAALAVISALLGAAPFTPAIVLFMAIAPMAALCAFWTQTIAPWVVAVAAVAAWLLTPLRFDVGAPTAPAMIWLAWVAGWCSVAIVLTRRSPR